MTNYWDLRFLRELKCEVKTIVEVGARYGTESLTLHQVFPDAAIYSFECNPNTVEICRKNLNGVKNIFFHDVALGMEDTQLPFYSYTQNNDGASSFYKRIDFAATQTCTGSIRVKPLQHFIQKYNLASIDLLCMDVQGFELEVLKGCYADISKVKYIILEEPKPLINTQFLPDGVHSKYILAPTSAEIKQFLLKNNFQEIVRIDENFIEDNVMYKNMN